MKISQGQKLGIFWHGVSSRSTHFQRTSCKRVIIYFVVAIIICITQICYQYSYLIRYSYRGQFETSVPTTALDNNRTDGNNILLQWQKLEFVPIPETKSRDIELAAAKVGIRWGRCHFDSTSGCPPASSYDLPKLVEGQLNGKRLTGSFRPWQLPLKYFADGHPYRNSSLFAVVRDPYDRAISAYNSVNNESVADVTGNASAAATMNAWIRETVQRTQEGMKDNEFDALLYPQYHYVYGDDGIALVRHVLTYKSLSNDFSALMKLFDLNVTFDDVSKEATQQLTPDDLDWKTIRLMNDYYDQDFRHFGYTKRLGGEGVLSKLYNLSQLQLTYYIYQDEVIAQTQTLKAFYDEGKALSRHDSDVHSERFVMQALESHPLRTRNGTEANFFIVPTPINELLASVCESHTCTAYDDAFSALGKQTYFRKTLGHNHVIVSFYWMAFDQSNAKRLSSLSRSYASLQNVTVAHHYDQWECQRLVSKPDPVMMQHEFYNQFVSSVPTTASSFSIGLGLENSPALRKASWENFRAAQYFVFYHARRRGFLNNSTIYRRAIFGIAEGTIPQSSIGHDIPKEEWLKRRLSSKFCLVVRGDTPHSHALFRALRTGCIPVVVSDYYPQYAGPLKSTLVMEDFCIFISEQRFVTDPSKEINALQLLSEEYIRSKLENITIAQIVLFPDCPESLFVPAFLKEVNISATMSFKDQHSTW